MEDYIVVNSIQRSCFHDGPGIRTTIFLHSCALKCPWCSNPESSVNNCQYIVNSSCHLIDDECPYKIECHGYNSTTELLSHNFNKCPIMAIEKVFDFYTNDKLKKEILKDRFLYSTDGGVTFSGGEPLIQSVSLISLMKSLKQEKINIAVETSLFVTADLLLKVIDYIDLFIVDLKILDSNKCLSYLQGNLEIYLHNIDEIFKRKKNVIFRIPLISPYVTNEDNLSLIYKFLQQFKPIKVEIFKGHNLAKEKYLKLGITYNTVETITDDEIKVISEKIELLGIDTEIIQF